MVWFYCCEKVEILSDVIYSHHPYRFTTFFLFPSHFVRDKKRKDASRHQNEKKLSGSTAHINNRFGAHNIGATIGMSGVQYSGSYWENCSGTISKRSVPVDNNMAVILSVVHTDINYSL